MFEWAIRNRYPMWQRFAQLRAEMDPAGKFLNEFAGRMLQD